MSHMLTTEADKDDGCLLVATLPVSTICVLSHRYLAVVLYTTLRRQNPRAFPVKSPYRPSSYNLTAGSKA